DPWNVAPLVYRVEPEALTPRRDERGFHRALRLHVAADFHLPVVANVGRDENDDQWDLAAGYHLALEIPILAVLSVGVSGGYLWWRFGEDFLDDHDSLHAFEGGIFARAFAISGSFRAFLGAHAGLVHLATEGGPTWGTYVGPQAGIQFGSTFGMEIAVGASYRRLPDRAPTPHGTLDPYFTYGFYFLLERPR
ncbi:MAG: hypothetical protein KC586_30860, partial [Myxococcales bacterium]|nr:hypothetical protein [Myxococcales bacterium]